MVAAVEGELREQRSTLPSPPEPEYASLSIIDAADSGMISTMGNLPLGQMSWVSGVPGELDMLPESFAPSSDTARLWNVPEIGENAWFSPPHDTSKYRDDIVAPPNFHISQSNYAAGSGINTPAETWEGSEGSIDTGISKLLQSEL